MPFFDDPFPPLRRRSVRERKAQVMRPLALSIMALTFAVTLTSLSEAQGTDDTGPAEPPAQAGTTSDAAPQIMTLARMAQVFTALDPNMEQAGAAFRMTIEDVPVLVISDPRADRMRAMVPIRSAEGLSEADLRRMMQANFDSALDARYAVAEGRVWAVFIHPLSPLRDDQLISGIGQTVNAALTYGTLFSSGGVQFGRGDSAGEQQKLLQRLQERGQDI